MTNKEAKEILKDLWRTKHSLYLESDIRKALDMAIKALEYDDAKYHAEHGEVVMDKAVWEDAKKALEQEPCENAISREKAKQFLYERLDRLNDNELYDIFSRIIDDLYNELPSITPTQRWIPVSERLPQYTADYTVTVGINNGGGMYYEVRTALYQTRFNQWIVYESEKTLVGEVIAWQDSPEPYKP